MNRNSSSDTHNVNNTICIPVIKKINYNIYSTLKNIGFRVIHTLPKKLSCLKW